VVRKLCAKCGGHKPLEQFKCDAARKDGRYPYCFQCDREYQRQHYVPIVPKSAAQRFHDSYVADPNSGCWLWLGRELGSHGYGSIKIFGRSVRAHRFSWELHFGPIPSGLLVCHKCDVPACVNPSHLFLGTHLDNETDKRAKGRARYRTAGASVQ
jgi:hypothetical protein